MAGKKRGKRLFVAGILLVNLALLLILAGRERVVLRQSMADHAVNAQTGWRR